MNVPQNESLACDATSIKCRLDHIFGDERFADVMFDVFLSEGREQGWNVAEPAWAKLTAAAIRNVGKHIKRLVSPRAGAEYILPAGTVAIAHVIGCVAIGWTTLCIECDRCGLNDISDMPHRPGGSNLVRPFQYIYDLSQDQPFGAVGMPKLVDQFNERHPDHLFQFAPFAPVADVILQREMASST